MKPILFSNGIEVCESVAGHRCLFMRYQYGKTAKGKPRQYRDPVGIVPAGPNLKKRQGQAVSDARNTLKARRAEIDLARLSGKTWVHPNDVAKREAEQAAQRQEQEKKQRDALLYETVVEDFLRDEAFDDAKPQETRRCLINRCSKAFAGKSWANLTQQDRKQYTLDRINSTGWFEGCNKVGPRTPQSELAYLRRVGNYLRRRGLMDTNPFAAAIEDRNQRSKKKARRSALTYVPERKPVLPCDDAVRLAFRLLETGWTKGDSKAVQPDPQFAALLGLSAYTGSRPESEPCKLRRADIELPSGNVRSMDGRPVLGTVTYRDTKCGEPVTVPLHPHAASLVGAWLQVCPEDREAHLFTKRGSKDPWDCNSYRDRWERLRAKVAETYPEFAGVWLRDFRRVFKTRLLDAGVNLLAVKRLQGHALDVSENYYELTDDHAIKAILTLNWRPGREAGREVAQG